MAIRVFISYRRGETDALVGRIYDNLASYFGSSNVFFDVDSLAAGKDFRPELLDFLDQTNVLVAIIGKDWGGTSGTTRHISSETDFVRMEIVTALTKRIPIVPIYFRTSVLTTSDLPSDLHPLVFANAFVINSEREFHPSVQDVRRSIVALARPSLARRSLWRLAHLWKRLWPWLFAAVLIACTIWALRDKIANHLATPSGVESILEHRDPQAFHKRDGTAVEVARVVPSRGQLLKMTDFEEVLQSTRETFDIQTLSAETINNRYEILQDLIDRGVKVRILIWDPSPANRANMQAYSSEIDQGGDVAMEEILAVIPRNAARLASLRSKSPSGGGVQVRYWRGPARHTMWVRDGHDPQHAIAHCEIIFRGDSYKNPIFRVGSLGPESLEGFRTQFDVLWNTSEVP